MAAPARSKEEVQKYLDTHDIAAKVQKALEVVVSEQPADAMSAIAK